MLTTRKRDQLHKAAPLLSVPPRIGRLAGHSCCLFSLPRRFQLRILRARSRSHISSIRTGSTRSRRSCSIRTTIQISRCSIRTTTQISRCRLTAPHFWLLIPPHPLCPEASLLLPRHSRLPPRPLWRPYPLWIRSILNPPAQSCAQLPLPRLPHQLAPSHLPRHQPLTTARRTSPTPMTWKITMVIPLPARTVRSRPAWCESLPPGTPTWHTPPILSAPSLPAQLSLNSPPLTLYLPFPSLTSALL